jgi:hypothetical protein
VDGLHIASSWTSAIPHLQGTGCWQVGRPGQWCCGCVTAYPVLSLACRNVRCRAALNPQILRDDQRSLGDHPVPFSESGRAPVFVVRPSYEQPAVALKRICFCVDVVGLVCSIGLIALWRPARRAASIEPMQALRSERVLETADNLKNNAPYRPTRRVATRPLGVRQL